MSDLEVVNHVHESDVVHSEVSTETGVKDPTGNAHDVCLSCGSLLYLKVIRSESGFSVNTLCQCSDRPQLGSLKYYPTIQEAKNELDEYVRLGELLAK